MENIHGSLYIIENNQPIFFENAVFIFENNINYIEVISDEIKKQEWEILIGEFNHLEYRKVTFVNCKVDGYSTSKNSIKYKIKFEFALCDIHILNKNEINFNECVIYTPLLTKWLNLNISSEIDHSNIDRMKFSIPNGYNICCAKLDEFDITIKVTYPFSFSNEKIIVEKSSLVKFHFNNDLDINEILIIVNKFKKLLLFLTNSSPEPSTISFKKDKKEETENEYSEWFKYIKPIKVLNESNFLPSPKLYYNDIKNQFENLIENWYNKDNLIMVCDFILEKRYNVELSFKSYYLNLCAAIESYTDIIKKRNFPKVIEREKKRKEISNLIEDENLKKWFESNTVYWKNPETKDRLSLYSKTIEYLMGDVFSFPVEEMITKMKKTRDNIAHHGTYDKILTPLELLMVTKILEFTIRVELIESLFTNHEEILKSFLNSSRDRIKYISNKNKYNEIS